MRSAVVIGISWHIPRLNQGGNVVKQGLPDVVVRLLKNGQIDLYVVGEQKALNCVDRHLQCLGLGVAVYSRGNQGERHRLTSVG